MNLDKFIEKTRTEPLYRAIVEAIFGGAVLWAFNTLWGPTLGIVHSTSGTVPMVLLMMVIYIAARGVYLARKGNTHEDS